MYNILFVGHFTEICHSCLTISVNVTTAVVGDVIMVITSIRQQPHIGITLFINDVASTNRSADLSCSNKNSVLGQQVVYYCTAWKSGTMIMDANTEFCSSELNSPQVDITIEEEERIMPNETHGMLPV